MTAWLDGAVVGEAALPKRVGVSPFETMGANGGDLPLWDLHLARLQRAAQRLSLPWQPDATWRAGADELLRANGDGDGVLRLMLLHGEARTHVVMVTRGRSPVSVVKLLPAVVERPADAPPGDLKAEPRRYYDEVRQQAQDGGADDGIVVADDGAVLETALGNLWLFVDGGWVTPALDGRVLPGIARALLLEQARGAGLAVRERACDLGDVQRAEALAHSNAVYGPRTACLVGRPPARDVVERDLQPLWREALARQA